MGDRGNGDGEAMEKFAVAICYSHPRSREL